MSEYNGHTTDVHSGLEILLVPKISPILKNGEYCSNWNEIVSYHQAKGLDLDIISKISLPICKIGSVAKG